MERWVSHSKDGSEVGVSKAERTGKFCGIQCCFGAAQCKRFMLQTKSHSKIHSLNECCRCCQILSLDIRGFFC